MDPSSSINTSSVSLSLPSQQRSHSAPGININLGKPSLRRRLEAYYSLISPQVLENEQEWKEKFDQIYEKFGGTVEGEATLANKLAKKYGDTVRLKLTTSATTTLSSINDARKRKLTTRDGEFESSISSPPVTHNELWYCLHPSEINSGILDFTQQGFDPVAALLVDTTLVYQANPFITTTSFILDNLSKCPSLLPTCDPQYKPQSEKTTSSHVSRRTSQTRTKKIPVFTAYATQYENTGPLSFLHQVHIQRKRIRVLVRYIDCIRGTVTGYLLAFDKHMNMILRDVDEVYTSRITKVFNNDDYCDTMMSKSEIELHRRRFITQDRERKLDSRGDKRLMNNNNNNNHNQQQQQQQQQQQRQQHVSFYPTFRVYERHIDQMFIRGDGIVSVWKVESEQISSVT